MNKSTLGRHRTSCVTGEPAGTPVATGCTPPPEAAPQTTPIVRHRTRPIDEAQRLDIALRMKARGCTRADIARAIGVSPGHVGEIIRRATDNAVELVRSQAVEELVAQHLAERHARVQALHAVLAVATLRNDGRTIMDVTRELRHEAKEDREWMRELGAFDSYRTLVAPRRDRPAGQESLEIMQEALREMVTAVGALEPDERLSPGPAGTTH
ncbi:hypothetical protein [Bosea lupini]|nr:hypothetical protein [Bosea lupini]